MKISVSITDGNQDYKLWAKAVDSVDLNAQGGFALVGDFLGVVPDQISFASLEQKALPPSTYTIHTGVPDGSPVVVCCTFTKKGEDRESDRVCFLASMKAGNSGSAVYISQFVEMSIQGDIEIIGVHGMMEVPIFTETPDGGKTRNPYYWAARTINDTPELAKKLGKGIGKGENPLKFYGRRSVKIGDKIVTMPNGYEFAIDMSGIWLVACVIPGKTKMQFADLFANLPGENEDIAFFLEQQAGLLRAMAMTYEIIAMAKKGQDV